eukprot:COSAG04_NODE_748_length_10610_cov_13.629436_6_plen_56_part_00
MQTTESCRGGLIGSRKVGLIDESGRSWPAPCCSLARKTLFFTAVSQVLASASQIM